MSDTYDEKPTLLAYSEEPLSVGAGGGMFGYGGVAVHQPVEGDLERLSMYPEKEPGTLGVCFSYSDTARITVDGLRKWINFNLADVPKGRQDIRETGKLRVELFDTEQLNAFIKDNREFFNRLGLKFIQ